MNVLIVTDFKAIRLNGILYVGTQFSTIAKRYKDSFGSISLCLRVNDTDNVPAGYECAHSFIDDYIPISDFTQLLCPKFQLDIVPVIEKSQLIIIRCPSVLGIVVAKLSKRCCKPYLTELMGDAWDPYWNHGFLGKLLAPTIYYSTKRCVAQAKYALYVTEHFLQKRYPCPGKTLSASNVLLSSVDDNSFQSRVDSYYNNQQRDNELLLMTTGAIDVDAKGQKFVIRAIPYLNRMGIYVKYYIVGGGDKTKLYNLARKLGVLNQVSFVGRLPLNKVFDLLELIDIYIQPSLQEGLPRSVIEAMSKGCLVIGSVTAGIPELVPKDCLIRKRNVKDIIDRIIYLHNLSPDKKAAISKRNFEKSKEFLCDVLDAKRNSFFNIIKNDIL